MLSTIMKNKNRLQDNRLFGNSQEKLQRTPTKAEVDDALFLWFTAAHAQVIPISGEVLKTKAEDLDKRIDPVRVEVL